MKSSEAHDEAMRRIEDAFESEAVSLDLGDLRLRELPEELGNLTELEFLVLGNRPFDQIEDGEWWDHGSRDEPLKFVFENIEIISNLKQLKRLGLGSCQQLTNLDFLGGMKDLTDLDISGCSNIFDLEPIASRVESAGN